MASSNGLKMEEDIPIKMDPDDATPSGFADDDEYEDTGELTMPREEQDIWLAKVPKWVWDAISTANDSDEPIQIGRIDMYAPDSRLPPQERQQSGKMTFNPTWPNASRIPKEYDVSFTKQNPQNMHIFLEKDLPGYKPNGFNQRFNNRGHDSNAPGNPDGKGGFKVQKRQRYRKAIPKQTALLRSLRQEVNCTPVENQEYRNFMEVRKREGEKSEIMLENGGDYLPTNAEMNFGTLIKGAAKPKSGQDNKAARISEAELVPILFNSFKRYKYWSLKSLRNETRQPEQYLKSVLSTIAVLVTSGPFNGHWTLKKEGNIDWDGIDAAEVAPDADNASEGDVGDDDDDDDNLEMEDVV